MNELKFQHDEEGGWSIVRLAGYVDAHTFQDFEEALTQLVEQGHYKIRLDFRGVTYINSTGLGLLMATHRQVRQHGGKLVLDNVSSKITNILNLLGFHWLKDKEDDDEEDEGLAGAAVKK